MSGAGTMPVRAAMILAAGRGLRMRPLTDHTAKPLLAVAGRSLLDHALDRFRDAGVDSVVVNAHWHADQVAARLRARAVTDHAQPRTILQEEPSLLDTGGAVLRALREGALPDDAPFFVANGDSYWLDGPVPALRRMAGRFDARALDVLLLVARTASTVGEVGRGDFAIDAEGRLRRQREKEIVPYTYAGVQLLSPRLFDGIGQGAFSMNALWDTALGTGRIRALVHDGPWFHISRPVDLADTERVLRDPRPGPSNA